MFASQTRLGAYVRYAVSGSAGFYSIKSGEHPVSKADGPTPLPSRVLAPSIALAPATALPRPVVLGRRFTMSEYDKFRGKHDQDVKAQPKLATLGRKFTKGEFDLYDSTLEASPDKRFTLTEFEALSEAGRIVVTYKGGVYDLTDFTGHPGGYGRIQMASGQDLEPFWQVYTQHNRGHVTELLQQYRVGHLASRDALAVRQRTHFDNPYSSDPPPKAELLTNTRYPYNAEAKLRDLTESFITPVGRHFVRNHGMVPDIDPETYSLTVAGEGVVERSFTLEELKVFPIVDVTTVIQCNGNRREDYHFLKPGVPAFGPPHWVAGAMGCATWSGIRLRDVLGACGLDVDGIATRKAEAPANAKYVGLLASDTDECGNQYCCSFPFEKAVDPFGDVILAFYMNGEPIPRQHGFPVRCIVPGTAGARNCKYLERVTVTSSPCSGDSNWKQYALHAADTPLQKLMNFELHAKELKKDPPVQEMPVQSLVTVPSAGDVLKWDRASDTVLVKGLAWGGGGEGVNRVDVSLDGGRTFTRADLLDQPVSQRRKAQWAWQFWQQRVALPDHALKRLRSGEAAALEVTCKALNTSWNVQPESPDAHYNPHGCCVNHWYRVPVTVCPATACDQRAKDGDFSNKPSGGAFRRPFHHIKEPS